MHINLRILILTYVMGIRSYYSPYFTDEKIEHRKVRSFAQGHTQLVNGEWSLYLNRLAWESIVSAELPGRKEERKKGKKREGRKSNE